MKTLFSSEPDPRSGPGLTGAVLKTLALASMTIDHAAAALLNRGLFAAGVWSDPLLQLYWLCRGVGRLAFPIYCFLLAEGFAHTSSRRAYAGRLFLFALLSEVPFDLAFHAAPFYPAYQNVFCTLLLGLLAVWALDANRAALRWAGPLGCVLAAELLHTDYGGFGVLLVLVFYLARADRARQSAAAGLLMLAQAARNAQWLAALELVSLPLLSLYNGRRGRVRAKGFFYWYYPAHLLAFWLLRRLLFAGVG